MPELPSQTLVKTQFGESPLGYALLSMVYMAIAEASQKGISSLTLRFEKTKLYDLFVDFIVYESMLGSFRVSHITKTPKKYITVTLSWQLSEQIG